MKVAKFGGSSVADARQFEKVKGIIQADPTRKVVVVSAAGKRSKADHKLTDLLYLCHAHLTYGVPCDEILEGILQRLSSIRSELGLRYDVEEDFDRFRRSLGPHTSIDELVSRGEYFTARLMAEYLGYTFLDAAECVFFAMDGTVDEERTYDAIRTAAAAAPGLVIPGFYGSLPSGRIRLMSRGGSDITGALAAAAVNAAVYENWTDVSGVLMADPRIVREPASIDRITYDELRELAFLGASVLHEDSIQPVKKAGIPLNIRNTNRPLDHGTMIVAEIRQTEGDEERFITGISGRCGFCVLTLRKHHMNANRCLRQALEIFEKCSVPVEQITLGLDSFALVSPAAVLRERLFEVVGELKKSCGPDDIDIYEDLALVAVVGRKMTSRPGTSGKIFQCLGQNGINVRTIHQAADEISIVVGVDNSDYEAAIRLLYSGFAG